MPHSIIEVHQETPASLSEDVYLTMAVQLLLECANERGTVSVSALRGMIPISKMLSALKTLENQGVLSSPQENNQRLLKVEAAQVLLLSLQNTQNTTL